MCKLYNEMGTGLINYEAHTFGKCLFHLFNAFVSYLSLKWGPKAAGIILLSSILSSEQPCEEVRLRDCDWLIVTKRAFMPQVRVQTWVYQILF